MNDSTEQEIQQHFKNVNVARDAILEELKLQGIEKDPNVRPVDYQNSRRWNGKITNGWCGGGVMDCPVCKTGKLKYSRALYNGHVHARCSTDNYVAWME